MTVQAETGSPIEINGVKIELTVKGKGKPLVFLHPGHPGGRLNADSPVIAKLAEKHHVIAPTHPGFGANPAPAWLTTVDDLAYLYLDLLNALGIDGAALVGVGFGGWIAAEIAVKNTSRLSHLVLANSVGIKVGDRETRDIADIYAVTTSMLNELAYADIAKAPKDVPKLPEETLLAMARSRESTGRYAWSPYMHNPKLKGRLHRIDVPTLVLWGEADRIVKPDYGRAFAAAIPGARFASIASAGHFPHVEQPDVFASTVGSFVDDGSRIR